MLPGRLRARRWRGRAAIAVPAALVCAYFLYHGLHGGTGYRAWQGVKVERERLAAELAAVQASNAALEVAIRGLRPDTVDADAVETALRELGYVREGELIILEPDARP